MTLTDRMYDLLPPGWLTRPEADLLWLAANRTSGPILEVGCYRGRSSVLLAMTGRPVYCVDPFSGFDSDDPDGVRVRREWELNTRHLVNVRLFPVRIEDWTDLPVGFAYLDGDHTYDGTVSQIHKALRCGAAGIAVHDVNDSGGGRQVKKACLDRLGKWTERAGRLAWWDRRAS